MARTHGTGVFLPVLVFTLIFCSISAQTIKAGSCPTPPPNSVGICVELCSGDEDCDGELKCCSNGCGHECTAPVNTNLSKIGFCGPQPNYGACFGDRTCETDFDCTGETKCCPLCRGTVCRDPVAAPLDAKLGYCPPAHLTPDQCKVATFVPCENDLSCEGDNKCCYNGCGHTCAKPVDIRGPCPVRPGKCPRPEFTSEQCELVDFFSCDGDDSCKPGQKCCFNGCGFSCTQPIAAKIGLCPFYSSSVCSAVHYRCSSDLSCSGDLKCCDNGCGTACVVPLPPYPKLGFCNGSATSAAAFKGTLAPNCNLKNCTYDIDCPGSLKCCPNTCGGTECSQPIYAP